MIKVNKPKIRFNEFENTWIKSKLGELYEVYSGNTPSRSDSRNYQNGEIPWIKTTDLNNSIIYANEEKISVYGATKLKVLPEKSVLIAMYGGFNQIGRTGLLAYPATINQALAALMPVNEINPNFLLNFLNFKKESWRNVAASSRKDPNITKNDVEKLIISFPSLDEQSAIGSLFRTLDDLLASYKDNLANYQSLKATMLSKMFPKDGQTVPEIRLEGFERKWEKKKLIDLVSPVSRKVKKPSDPYYRLSIRSHAKGTFKQFVDDPKKIAMDNLFEVKENDLVVNITFAWEHAIAVASKEDDGLLVSHRFPTFVIDKSDKNFINIYIKREEFRQKMDLLSPGGAGRNRVLNVKDFINIQMVVPELKEQQAIGAYFSILDNLINSHQEKISQLETLKKKLLQDMFI